MTLTADNIMKPRKEQSNPCKGLNAEMTFFRRVHLYSPLQAKPESLSLWKMYGTKPIWKSLLING